MTKKGFTLMELLVSIFITGMVMLSLVAMWRTSSSQTAQAQRQSVIRNENTIFLRRFYSDFVSASEILCPWAYGDSIGGLDCPKQDDYQEYIAVKEVVIKHQEEGPFEYKLERITEPVCNTDDGWDTNSTSVEMSLRCIKPSYVVYRFANNNIYRCENKDNFLTGSTTSSSIQDAINSAHSYCNSSDHPERWELVLPYVSDFDLSIKSNLFSEEYHAMHPELLIDYTVNREFGEGIPPVTFKFKRFLTKKRGV